MYIQMLVIDYLFGFLLFGQSICKFWFLPLTIPMITFSRAQCQTKWQLCRWHFNISTKRKTPISISLKIITPPKVHLPGDEQLFSKNQQIEIKESLPEEIPKMTPNNAFVPCFCGCLLINAPPLAWKCFPQRLTSVLCNYTSFSSFWDPKKDTPSRHKPNWWKPCWRKEFIMWQFSAASCIQIPKSATLS